MFPTCSVQVFEKRQLWVVGRDQPLTSQMASTAAWIDENWPQMQNWTELALRAMVATLLFGLCQSLTLVMGTVGLCAQSCGFWAVEWMCCSWTTKSVTKAALWIRSLCGHRDWHLLCAIDVQVCRLGSGFDCSVCSGRPLGTPTVTDFYLNDPVCRLGCAKFSQPINLLLPPTLFLFFFFLVLNSLGHCFLV